VAALCGAVALPACGVFDSSDDVDQAVRNLDLATRGVTLNDRVIGTINEAKSSVPTIPAEVAPLVREVKALREDLRNQEITSKRLASAIDQQARAIGTLRSLARANIRGQVSINRAQDIAQSISRSLARSERNYRTVINVSLGVFRREGYLTAQSKRRLARIEVRLDRQRQRVQGINRQNTIVAKVANTEEPEPPFSPPAASTPEGSAGNCGTTILDNGRGSSTEFTIDSPAIACDQAISIAKEAWPAVATAAGSGIQAAGIMWCYPLTNGRDYGKPAFRCDHPRGGGTVTAIWPNFEGDYGG